MPRSYQPQQRVFPSLRLLHIGEALGSVSDGFPAAAFDRSGLVGLREGTCSIDDFERAVHAQSSIILFAPVDAEAYMQAALARLHAKTTPGERLLRSRIVMLAQPLNDGSNVPTTDFISCTASPLYSLEEAARIDPKILLERRAHEMYAGLGDPSVELSPVRTNSESGYEIHRIDALRPDGSGASYTIADIRGYRFDCSARYSSAHRDAADAALESLRFVTVIGREEAAPPLNKEIAKRIECFRLMADAQFFASQRDRGTTRQTASMGIRIKYSMAGPMTGLSEPQYSEYLSQVIGDVYSSSALTAEDLSQYMERKCSAWHDNTRIVSAAGFESRFVECAAHHERKDCYARMSELTAVSE